jgi:hypothetical protein
MPAMVAALRHTQLLQRLAEIHLGGGADTVGALSEENLVEIQREYLFLGEFPLDLHGQDQLLGLAHHAALAAQESRPGPAAG